MKNTILAALGLAMLLGIWGCKSKDSEPSPATSPTTVAPPGPPGGPAPGGAPTGPGMPGAPAGPGMAAPGGTTPAAPAAPADAAKPEGAKPAEKPAPKKDDSDDPFSSSMTAPPRQEAGKTNTIGALGRAFLRAAAAGGDTKGTTK